MQDLPKTSYYKLMDWWLLISVNCLVYSMAVHTYLAKVVKDEADKLELEAERQKDEEQQQQEAWTPQNSASRTENGGKKMSAKDVLKAKLKQGQKKSKKSKPEWVNHIGKIGFIVINVVSNFIIGIVALVEYVKDPEEYL